MQSIQAPTIVVQNSSEGVLLQLQGHWGAAALSDRQLWQRLRPQLRQAAGQAGGRWDLRQAEGFDHIAAQVVWDSWGGRLPEHLQASPSQQAILERVAALTVPVQEEPRQNGLLRAFEQVGDITFGGLVHLTSMVQLMGQLLLDVLRLLRRPLRGPWHDFSAHVFRMGAQALPITALVGFLIGVVIAYLLALQLRQFGADAFIVNVLGISLTRELGPLLAAILVAGRSGSAITAQIGVMRVNEELDAMRVMGIAQGFRLVMPRALALALAMPLVSVWTTLAALLGGIVAADVSLGITPAYFMQALPDAVDIANLWLATAKSVVFGIAIALIACHWGLWVKPNTESLGEGTTASVVTSITSVIIIDAVFAILFRSVGF
ncbi:ABC transporter permease [Corticibacter populi]|uniref:ABC transporter permease n=1 Tax=Corticibacter populi TaxID=1550736 RepID=A0A3M6QXN7_9BURK|nr:ABC transporter permease [Corticibacter populi]RMX07777.1 ABC transporter permease [Corticibacter populi]RZS35000.1 phospholipid/cholesterol/gamma-HCH transport system permease protein [Corticibacter populi]